MSAKEIYAGKPEQPFENERRSGRRFAIILGVSILVLFALTVGGLYIIFKSRAGQRKPAASSSSRSSVASNKAAPANENYQLKIAGRRSEARACFRPA